MMMMMVGDLTTLYLTTWSLNEDSKMASRVVEAGTVVAR